MPLLLTILSTLAVWALLAVLIVGLLLILKTLTGIRGHLERIAMGVRAIEQEAAPLDGYVDRLAPTLNETAHAVDAVARRLAEVNRDLDATASVFRPQ